MRVFSSRIRALGAAVFLIPSTTAHAQRVATMAGRSPVYAPNGVAATSQPLATTAALEVLEHVNREVGTTTAVITHNSANSLRWSNRSTSRLRRSCAGSGSGPGSA